jgi:hypothetical protein
MPLDSLLTHGSSLPVLGYLAASATNAANGLIAKALNKSFIFFTTGISTALTNCNLLFAEISVRGWARLKGKDAQRVTTHFSSIRINSLRK